MRVYQQRILLFNHGWGCMKALYYTVLASLAAATMVAGCQVDAPPPPPSALSSNDDQVSRDGANTGDDLFSNANSSTRTNNIAYKFGAPVGSNQQRQQVNVCNESGQYYDRFKNTCSSVSLVKDVECTHSGLLSHMDVGADGMKDIDAFLAAQKDTFHFDQCAQTSENYWTIYLISDAMKTVSVCVNAPGPCPK